jgi:hypothetical protein
VTTDDYLCDGDHVIRLPTQSLDQIDLDLADKDVLSTTIKYTTLVDTNSLFARVRSDLGLVLDWQASGRLQRGWSFVVFRSTPTSGSSSRTSSSLLLSSSYPLSFLFARSLSLLSSSSSIRTTPFQNTNIKTAIAIHGAHLNPVMHCGSGKRWPEDPLLPFSEGSRRTLAHPPVRYSSLLVEYFFFGRGYV